MSSEITFNTSSVSENLKTADLLNSITKNFARLMKITLYYRTLLYIPYRPPYRSPLKELYSNY